MTSITQPERIPGNREQLHAPSALAIDIGGTKTAFAWVGADGSIIDSFRVPTPAPKTARDEALQQLRDHVRRVRGWRTRFGTCIVVRPGLMSYDVVELSPNTPAWEDAALAQLVRDELGEVHIRFENDVRAATYGEMVAGRLRDVDPGLYVNLGTGVAAALVVSGRIVAGAHGAAGEIGYMKPSPVADAVRGDGVPPAPLEELLGGPALGRRASKMLGRAVSPRELFAARDPVSVAFVGETAALISTMLGNLCTLLDPQRIVFGGGLARSFDRWAPVVRSHMAASFPYVPELVVSQHVADGSLFGAAMLCSADLPQR